MKWKTLVSNWVRYVWFFKYIRYLSNLFENAVNILIFLIDLNIIEAQSRLIF